MREILFRGKVKNGKFWIYGYYCPKPFTRFPCKPAIYPINALNQDYCAYEIDVDTLGRYAGLTDKNDNRIFEGDIVKGTNIFGDIVAEMVMFENGMFCIDGYPLGEVNDAEVIGNIHDNPELLEMV